MPDQTQSEAKQLQIAGGEPPLMADLAAVMPAAPALMDRLVSEFAPTATTLSTNRPTGLGSTAG